MKSVLFVCLGNVCRSPTAEAVFRQMAEKAGLDVVSDSAGTAAWHEDEPPHAPMIEAAATRGYDLSVLRARQVSQADFARFDLILAMDRRNLAHLRAIAPADGGAQLRLFMDSVPGSRLSEVPDPWLTDDYVETLDLVESGCRAWIGQFQNKP